MYPWCNSYNVSDCIVSVSQPLVLCPIVLGKASCLVEFGAKLDISVVNGWTRLLAVLLHPKQFVFESVDISSKSSDIVTHSIS